MIAQLKEFKLQAEKHLCSIPVTDQIYIYTEGHLLNLHWKKKKRENTCSSFISEFIEDDKGFIKLVVEHLVAPWQLSHASLSATSHLVQTLVSSLPLRIWRSHNKQDAIKSLSIETTATS